MNSLLWASLGAVFGLLIALYLRNRRRKGVLARDRSRGTYPPSGKPLNKARKGGFHGVSVKPGLHACKAVQALAGQRFLPQETPAMPLPGCDQVECRCSYAHHGDRRDPEDRRTGWGSFGGFTPSVPGGNRRRTRKDRRG